MNTENLEDNFKKVIEILEEFGEAASYAIRR